MRTADVQKLCQLNLDFYEANHASFSKTRQNAWPGWERIVPRLPDRPVSVLDMACGNLRLKAFLDQAHVETAGRYFAVDSCGDLLPPRHDASFQQLDIVGALLEGDLASRIEAPNCDLAACFGFMHHVPTDELRMGLLDALLAKTAPSGMLAVSFWQFARDPHMREKALATTARGQREHPLELEEGDFLLGWNDVEGAYRYCHSFSDAELDMLVAHCKTRAACVERFRADGRSNEMNGYLVFRKR